MTLTRESSERTEKTASTINGTSGRIAVDHQVGKDIHSLRAQNSTMPESLRNNVHIAGLTVEAPGNSKPHGGALDGGSGGNGAGPANQMNSIESHSSNSTKQSHGTSPGKEIYHPGKKPGDYSIERKTKDGTRTLDKHTGNPDGGYTETHTEGGRTNTNVYDANGKHVYGKDFYKQGGFHEFKKDADGRETDRFQKPNGDYTEFSTKDNVLSETEHKKLKNGGFSDKKWDSQSRREVVHEQDAKGNYKEQTKKDNKTTTVEHTVKPGGSYTEKSTDPEGRVTTKEHTAKEGGSYSEKITDAAGGITTTEHSARPDGSFSEKTTDPKGGVTTKERTISGAGAYRDVTVRPDGTKVTFDKQASGNSYELTEKDKQVVSLKSHETKADGGFVDRATDEKGTFVHDQQANGDYTERTTDKTGRLTTPPLEVKGASPEFAEKAKAEINKLPAAERQLLADAGYRYTIADKVTTAEPSLAGQTPVGHLPGTTWDDLDGFQNADKRQIVATEKATGGLTNRVDGVLRHETGHAVDAVLGEKMGLKDYSQSQEFKDAYKQDFAKLSSEDKKQEVFRYLTQVDQNGEPSDRGRSETFADVYGAIRGASSNPGQTQSVLDHFPHVAELLRKKMAGLENAP